MVKGRVQWMNAEPRVKSRYVPILVVTITQGRNFPADEDLQSRVLAILLPALAITR
jgi:hypothetical protein